MRRLPSASDSRCVEFRDLSYRQWADFDGLRAMVVETRVDEITYETSIRANWINFRRIITLDKYYEGSVKDLTEHDYEILSGCVSRQFGVHSGKIKSAIPVALMCILLTIS